MEEGFRWRKLEEVLFWTVLVGGDAVLGDCGRGSPTIPSDSLLGSRFSGGGGSSFSESGFTIEGS